MCERERDRQADKMSEREREREMGGGRIMVCAAMSFFPSFDNILKKNVLLSLIFSFLLS